MQEGYSGRSGETDDAGSPREDGQALTVFTLSARATIILR